MKLNPSIIEALSRRCGMDVTRPRGASHLCHDIESATGQHLSLNTLKRLTGVIPYDGAPREATLEIIAGYLGYGSAALMAADMDGRTSGFNLHPSMVEVNSLPEGTRLEIGWEPDRSLTLTHLGHGRCRVEQVANSKLEASDILLLTQVAEGFPLLAADVERAGRSLGPFAAGKQKGITLTIVR